MTHEPWPTDALSAQALQDRLRDRVVREDRLPAPLTSVAGLDLSLDDGSSEAHAAAVVLAFPGLVEREVAIHRTRVTFPYIPGLLAFRELPALVAVFRQLTARVDVILVDGHGYAHPRRFGVACHLGVHLDVPTIGCGKTPYVGAPAGELAEEPGATVPIVDAGEVVAMALRTRRGSKPIYVSVGHRVSLESAVALVRACTTGTRVPRPTQAAHVWANRARRGET